MADPGTGLVVLGTALGSKDLVLKVLGPTAEYVGESLQRWTQRRVENVARIFEAADRRLPPEVKEGPGSVPPRVLKQVIDEGSFVEDPLAAEYFGGIMASARTEAGRDDRGAALTATLGRLSTYTIRSHYVLYRVVREAFLGQDLYVGHHKDRDKMRTYVSMTTYANAMEFTDDEDPGGALQHSVYALRKEDLLHEEFGYGQPQVIGALAPGAPEPGIVFYPTPSGTELFLWAHGLRNPNFRMLLDPDLDFSMPGAGSLVGSRGPASDYKALHEKSEEEA